jgi:hypothetical protein
MAVSNPRRLFFTFVFTLATPVVLPAMPNDQVTNELLTNLASSDETQRRLALKTFEGLDPQEQGFLASSLLDMCAVSGSKVCPRPPGELVGKWMARRADQGVKNLRGNAAQRESGIVSLEAVGQLLKDIQFSQTPVFESALKAYDGPSLEKIAALVAGQVGDSEVEVRSAAAKALRDLGPMGVEGAMPVLSALAKNATPEVRRDIVQLLQGLEPTELNDALKNIIEREP